MDSNKEILLMVFLSFFNLMGILGYFFLNAITLSKWIVTNIIVILGILLIPNEEKTYGKDKQKQEDSSVE